MWYNLLLSWPVFATCFWINVSPSDPPLCPLASCIGVGNDRKVEFDLVGIVVTRYIPKSANPASSVVPPSTLA